MPAKTKSPPLATWAHSKGASTFSGVAIVDENAPDVAATMTQLVKQGVRGFRIYTDKAKAEAWSSSDGMKKMWSYAADAGLSMCLLANPDALPAVHRMCKAYPKTRVVIDHFARIGVKGSVEQSDLDNLCRLAEFENVYVKTSAFYALGAKKAPYTDLGPMIRKLREDYVGARGRAGWREFHDRLLSRGGPPLPLLRQELLGDSASLL